MADFVQGVLVSVNAQTLTATLPNPVRAGNRLLMIATDVNIAVSQVTDTDNNAWYPEMQSIGGPGGTLVEMWSAYIATEGTKPTVTALLAATSTASSIILCEYEGIAPSPNLLRNGDFETDASDWINLNNCTVATSNAQAYTGTQSLAVTATTAAAFQVETAHTYPCTPGSTINVVIWAKAAATGRTGQASIKFWKAGGTASTVSPQITGTAKADVTTGWTPFYVNGFTVPSDAVNCSVQMFWNAAAINEVHYIDTASLILSVVVDAWAQGGSTSGHPSTVTVGPTTSTTDNANTMAIGVYSDQSNATDALVASGWTQRLVQQGNTADMQWALWDRAGIPWKSTVSLVVTGIQGVAAQPWSGFVVTFRLRNPAQAAFTSVGKPGPRVSNRSGGGQGGY